MENEKQSKILYIQLLRILAILAVVALHAIAGYFADSSLYATKTWWALNVMNSVTRFGVPVFLMISGYLILKGDPEEPIGVFLKRRFSRILIPFLVWNGIYIAADAWMGRVPFSLGGAVLRVLQRDVSYHFWFVYLLIALYLFAPLGRKLISRLSEKEIWYLLLLIVLPTTVIPMVNHFFQLYVPFFYLIVEGYAGYFVLGYLLGKKDWSRKQRCIIYGLGILCIFLAVFGTYYHSNVQAIDFFYNGGYTFNSYCIAMALFLFVRYELPPIKGHVAAVVDTLGNLAYGVYLMHVLVMDLLAEWIQFPALYQNVLFQIMATIILSFALSYVLYRIKAIRRFFL